MLKQPKSLKRIYQGAKNLLVEAYWPHVVWFGENLDEQVLDAAHEELEECDLCLVVGTSSVVYPAAMFAPQVAARGVPVAEFNMETTPATQRLGGHGFFFQGPCGTTLPPALAP